MKQILFHLQQHPNRLVATVCFLFMMLCALQSLSAQTISYDYDAAGNRIARRVVVLPQQLSKSNTEKPVPLSDQLGELRIQVFPNPTRGRLTIDIQGGDSKETRSLTLFDAHGKQLINQTLQTGPNTIDLSNFPATWYIMRITTGSNNKEYKIIKE